MTNTTTPSSPFKKVLKKALYIFIGVVLLLLIVAIFLPKKIDTSVSEEINAPKAYVYNLINNQNNAVIWNDWMKSDPKIKLTYNDIKEGKGSGYSWDSEAMGKGSLLYTDVMQDSMIMAELTLGDSDKSYYTQLFSEAGGKTKLEWKFEAELSYPSNLMGPIYKSMMKKSFKKCFAHVSEEIERRKQGKYNGFQVNEQSQNIKHFVASRSVVKFDNISQFYTQNLAAVYQKLQETGITGMGAPASLFYTYDEVKKETDMAVGVQVLEAVNVKDLSAQSMPASNAVVVDYFGDFALTGEGHMAIDAYMKDRKLQAVYPVIEEYLTDPLKEKDMKKWQTRIYYYTGSAK